MEVPRNKDLTYIGTTTYRDKNQVFGIKRKDRRQHVYVLGKSGTGKSALLSNMIFQNIQNGEGVCVVDPHGELVETVLQGIPAHRMKDVIYFNPADTDFHVGFNVLELTDPKYKHLVASGLMGIFTKIWANAWSARMEYILNNCILALLDTPGTTLLGIPRILVDKKYRAEIVGNLQDPVIKAFWINEYESWNEKFRNEAIAAIQNKVGQFLSSSIIRNVVGQSKSTINIFDVMNDGKIFLVNVSKGRIGEDNSALLGGMLITKIQLAAMERVRIPEDDRKDFYLYVDEFQNFVTDAFASILSEARKYRLNLTIAHQYTAQLVTENGSAVRDAVFGNVGTIIVFRVGSEDAAFLENEFDPEFTPQDIVNLPNYKIYLRLMIDGVTSRPFSARTLPPMIKPDPKIEEEVIKMSRALYCRPKDVIEKEINDWSGMFADTPKDSDVEKFAAKCSNCGKDTMVPFKPEPGRPVYCKDCIAKIKSGELKIPKAAPSPMKSEVKVAPMQPIAPTSPVMPAPAPMPRPIAQSIPPTSIPTPAVKPAPIKPASFVWTKPIQKEKPKPPVRPVPGENFALRDILNKTLSENKILTPEPAKPEMTEEIKPIPAPISLSDLNTSKPSTLTHLKDRSASMEDMNKLKNLISEKNSLEKETIVKVREVPEDILKKILE